MLESTTTCLKHASPAESRYIRRMMRSMLAYVILLFAITLLLKGPASGFPAIAKALLAIVPVIPVAFVGKAFIAYLGECDEMIRRIELEAVSLSSLLVGLLFLAAGFVMQTGAFKLDGGVVAIWVFPLLCGTYGFTKWLAIRRYR